MENQHCKMRWDLSLAVLQGLQTQPGSTDTTPPLAWGKQQLSGSQRTPQLGSLSLPPPASLLICWHRFPTEVKEGTNILPQCAGKSHVKPYPLSLAGGAQAQRCWRRTDCVP